MRAAVLAIILTVAVCAVTSAETTKISIDLKDVPLKQAADEISQKAGAGIVVDPKAEGSVTAKLNNVELAQALDVVTKANKLTWKKMQFAKQEDKKVSLDQLKSAALTLATMPLVGFAVEDPESKKSSLYARDLESAPDVATVTLPAGHSWATVYVILAPESTTPEAATAATAAPSEKVKVLSEAATQHMMEMASLSSEDRRKVYQSELVTQLSMTPEVRRAMMHDRMHAIRDLDPAYRDQLRNDWGGRRARSRNRGGNSSGNR